ncbi:MAG: AN1-type zinc finger domain-containing protein [Candidatus Bathyarchaeia archaeon]
MVKCQQCGEEVAIPFKCSYCGKLFCYEHRLPENHQCDLTSRTYTPRLAPEAPRRSLTQVDMAGFKARSIFQMTSLKELKHLAVALSVFIFIGFSMLINNIPFLILNLGVLTVTVVGMVLSFLIHELAHKIVAQRMGYWAEFRLSIPGLMLTLLSIILPFKIIAPGAVRVVGLYISKDGVGKIAFAGPLTNIIQAIIYVVLLKFYANSPLTAVALLVLASLNLSLALFNLIPIDPMDGAKVFKWSKSVWVASIIAVVALWLSLITVTF